MDILDIIIGSLRDRVGKEIEILKVTFLGTETSVDGTYANYTVDYWYIDHDIFHDRYQRYMSAKASVKISV